MAKPQIVAREEVKIDPVLQMQLEALSKAKDCHVDVLLEAVKLYITAQNLKQETLSRWQTEAEKSLSVDHNQVVNWLKTWGSDNEQKRPPCK